MSALRDAVVVSLEELGWGVEQLDTAPAGEHHLLLSAPADQPQHPVVVVVHDGPAIVGVYSVSPFDVPLDARPAAMVYLVMANHGLLLGNFELDLADGEVRFKTSVRAAQLVDLTDELRQQVGFNVAAFSAYLPGLASVSAGETDPQEAIALVEGDRSGGDPGNDSGDN